MLSSCFMSESGTPDQLNGQQSANLKKTYTCSMHPDVVQDKPGDCPICGMSLIEKPVHAASQKSAVYVCSMHPEVIQDKPGDCPICGMSLIIKPDLTNSPKTLTYVCSMHPDVVQDKPGDCPICGMTLIEKVAQDNNSLDINLNDVVLPVNENVIASVQTVTASREELPITVEASGVINYDTRKVTTVSARFRGLIEKSYIKYKFQPIKKGQKIYEIYCPEIYIDHMNYVNLVKKFPNKPELTHDAMDWLHNIGLTDQQIEKLKTDEKPDFHLSVYSDSDGYVVGSDFNPDTEITFESNDNNTSGTSAAGNFGIGLREGVMVETGTPLFKILNLQSVRADLKIRTEDAGLLKAGQNIIITDAVSPDYKMNAKISLIEPLNGGLFQVVRAYISQPQKQLYPGMKIQAQIQATKRNSLWAPKKAVIDLGQSQAVFLLKDKSFVAVAVKTGLKSGDKIEISNGIDENSKIAANASLLTDSDGFIKTLSK